MSLVASSLRRAYDNGNDLEARENMSMAAMLGGMALANGKLGAVHGFAAPLGGMFPAPHGAVCATLLPAVMLVNLRRASEKEHDNAQSRYAEIARLLTGNPHAAASEGIEWITEMKNYLKIPSLSTYGLKAADFETLALQAKKSGSMQGNPFILEDRELTEILEHCL
jgi:alcohol dehydrogenase class IV